MSSCFSQIMFCLVSSKVMSSRVWRSTFHRLVNWSHPVDLCGGVFELPTGLIHHPLYGTQVHTSTCPHNSKSIRLFSILKLLHDICFVYIDLHTWSPSVWPVAVICNTIDLVSHRKAQQLIIQIDIFLFYTA